MENLGVAEISNRDILFGELTKRSGTPPGAISRI